MSRQFFTNLTGLIMETSNWLIFFAASCAFSISPGPNAIASMNAGLQHGFRRGYVTVFGPVLGIWTQLVFVIAGFGTLIYTSVVVFSAVKWLGVAYLVWIGISQWRASARPWLSQSEPSSGVRQRTIVFRAWVISTLNPKTTVFLLAVVPQFIMVNQPLTSQYMVIGLTLAFTEMVVMASYTAMASKVLLVLKKPAHVQILNRVLGGLLVAAGSSLALFNHAN